MKFTELKNDIKEGARSIYLLQGDDAYFRMKAEEMLLNAFVQMPELNYTLFDGENLKGANITSLVSAVESYPFMAEKRVVKVNGLYPTEKEYDTHLKALFENFPQTSVLIINNSENKKGVDLKRKKNVTYVDCNRCDDEDTVTKWVYLNLKKAGVTAGVDVCALVGRYCLLNMSRVAVETEKIIDYKCGGGTLTKEEVEALVFKETDYRIYEMTNAISQKNYDKYLTIQSELCVKNGDEAMLLASMFSYFKNLLASLTHVGADGEVATLLGMKEFAVKKNREQARAIGREKLQSLVCAVYRAVADIKSGLLTPQSALQKINAKIFFE